MKNLIVYSLLLSFAVNLVAQEVPGDILVSPPPENFYTNLREDKSTLISSAKEDKIARLYSGTKAFETLKNIIADKNINRCATKLNYAIQEQLKLSNDDEVTTAILGLRLNNSIDDIFANILIKALSLSRPMQIPITKDNLDQDEERKALQIFSSKVKDIKNKALCKEDTYRSIVAKLVSESPKFGRTLKRINKIAMLNGLINDSEYNRFEKFRVGKVHEWKLTLSEYAQSLEAIAKKFPNRVKESSNLITDDSEGKFRNKKSLRQSLYEKYDSNQIILLANIVKELKTRLESKDITININYDDHPSEIINLSPMEKFRFILKVLRKQLSDLNNGSLLNGNKASYIDLITASYEVGYISANEIEQLASLEDIWNPKKTPKEKAMSWVKRFGGVASVLLPPPFGFVAVMAIMLIDQYIAEAPISRDPDDDIF